MEIMGTMGTTNIVESVRGLLAEILDVDGKEITQEAYVIRDLGAESIDLLELSVALNARFGVEINDTELFLRRVRTDIREAEESGREAADYLAVRLPFLGPERIREIIGDLNNGPVLKVKDLVAYVHHGLRGKRR